METSIECTPISKERLAEIGLSSGLNRFLALYQSFGINLEVYLDEESSDGGLSIVMMGEDNVEFEHKLDGGTYTSIHFDKNGKFIKQNFWE